MPEGRKKPPSFSVAMVRGLKIMASPLSLLTRRVVAMIRLPTLPLLCWCMVRICRNRSQRWTASKLPMANAASTLRGAKSVRLRCLRKTANTPLFSWITVMAVWTCLPWPKSPQRNTSSLVTMVRTSVSWLTSLANSKPLKSLAIVSLARC